MKSKRIRQKIIFSNKVGKEIYGLSVRKDDAEHSYGCF